MKAKRPQPVSGPSCASVHGGITAADDVQLPKIAGALSVLLGDSFFSDGALCACYGSRKAGRDCDLVLVQPSPTLTPHFVAGQLDVFLVSYDGFSRLVDLLDPLAAEPLLTGTLLLGSVGHWSALQDRLRATPPTEACIHHACQRSVEETCNVDRFLLEWIQSRRANLLAWALQNLSYAISYGSLAIHYAQRSQGAESLASLRSHGHMLMPDFWEYYDSVKAGAPVVHEDVEACLSRWRSHLPDLVVVARSSGE